MILEKKNKKNKKYYQSLKIIKYIKLKRDITYLPINNKIVEIIKKICIDDEEKDYILEKIHKKTERRNLITVGSVVEFAKSKYTVVHLDKEKMTIDIKQNFSIGVVYEKVGIFEVRFLK